MNAPVQLKTLDQGPAARFETVKADAHAPAEILRLLIGGIGEPVTLAQIREFWGLTRSFASWFQTEHADLHAIAQKVLSDVRLHAFFTKPGLPRIVIPDGKPHCFFAQEKSCEYIGGIDERGPFVTIRPHGIDDRQQCADCKRPTPLI